MYVIELTCSVHIGEIMFEVFFFFFFAGLWTAPVSRSIKLPKEEGSSVSQSVHSLFEKKNEGFQAHG